MEEVKKNSFFKDFLKSIKSFEKYEDFALEGMKKSSKYILKLISLFCLIVSISSTIYIFSIVHKVFNDLKNTTVNFSFKNNKLSSLTINKTITLSHTSDKPFEGNTSLNQNNVKFGYYSTNTFADLGIS